MAPTKKTPAKKAVKKVTKPKTVSGTDGMIKRLSDKDTAKPWEPSKVDRAIATYVNRRTEEMKDFRRGLNIENKWREADEEYVPHELDYGTTRKRFETDQDTGLRSRMVPVGDSTQQWRQASSAPVLLAKIQTAMSLIIDNQPEADLVSMLKKYDATTAIAYALWKRNWSITGAREKLKLFVFNLIKYGWSPQRTYPRLVKYDKRTLAEVDPENPENNKYETNDLVWFNDVDREPLNPFRTWIDEQSKPYDQYSTNESYFEKDYSYDSFKVEFGQYPAFECVPRDSAVTTVDDQRKNTQHTGRTATNTENMRRKDIVTVGFFESRLKDLFVIYIPKHKIVLHASPLPNDDGYISITHTLWILRNAELPYGISLWEVIRQNKALYDKMKNMTMDQLVLSIMKFGFFSGTSTALGDGKMEIIPGQARQLTSATGKPEVDWMEIPGPGQESWKGLEAINNMMDDDSGISPTMEGEITGKTLGEILHAKEAGLKRMKVPVENIAWAIDQDAYLTLSWMAQIYSIPMVKEFTNDEAMLAFEKENEMERHELFTGEKGGLIATYMPQLSLHLEDREGKMFQSKESKFYTVGKEIQPAQLRWRGIFKTIPRSIIDSSQELMKASKMELFNILVPLLQQPDPKPFIKAITQILKVNEEDPTDWLPDEWIKMQLDTEGQSAEQPEAGGLPMAEDSAMAQLFQKIGAGGPPAPGAMPDAGGPGNAGANPGTAPVPGGQQSMQAESSVTPNQGAQTVVPRGQTSGPTISQIGGGNTGGLFKKRS